MFYKLSAPQIQAIKEKMYPQQRGITTFLKNVIVNDYGAENSHNSFRIIYSFEDGNTFDEKNERYFKVFNNQTAIKYMKLKLFEILSPEMSKEIESFIDIKDLENIISKYGALSQTLTPSLDFIGPKNDPALHNMMDRNHGVIMSYETTFLLSRPQINFFSLGAIFYLDKEEYIKDQNVEERFLETNILFDKVMIYKLYKDNKIVNTAPVQDLRLIKSTFKEISYLENLLNLIITGNNLNSLLITKNYLKQNDKLTPFSSRNDNVSSIMDFGKGKIIKKLKLIKKSKKAFSNTYFSRNSNNTLGILFNVNFEELINENTSYRLLLQRSAVKEDLINKCKISSIKIMRRAVSKNNKNVYTPKLNTEVIVAQSGETKEKNTILETSDEKASLTEIALNTGSGLKLRSFSASDKKVFLASRGLYQYGVEMVITNGIYNFLNDYIESLEPQIANLNEYLEETNKIAKVVESEGNVYTLQGSYDPQKSTFTAQFIQDFTKPRNLAPSFSTIVTKAVSSFVTTLKIFGVIKEDDQTVQPVIISLLDPQQTRAETIIYFINVFKKLISQLKNTLKNNYNNTFTVQRWFTNKYIDTTTPINIGYRFLDFNSFQGLGLLSSNKYRFKITSDLNRYALNPNLEMAEYGKKLYSYVSPNEIYSNNKMLSLRELENNKQAISDLDFAELEIDIKNTNLYGTTAEAVKLQNKIVNPLNRKKADVAIKSKNLSNSFSLNIKNSVKEIKDDSIIKQNNSISKNNNVNETQLMLALAKHFDLSKNTFSNSIKVPLQIDKSNLSSGLETVKNSLKNFNQLIETSQVLPPPPSGLQNSIINNDLPTPLRLLLDNKCALLNSSQNYKNSLSLNSKFQFLFNTLHSIEILEYSLEDLEENWVLLTKEKLDSLNTNDVHLCRLKNYKNKLADVNGLEQISLPIYDEYFLLLKDALPSISLPTNKINSILNTTNASIQSKVEEKIIKFIAAIPPKIRVI